MAYMYCSFGYPDDLKKKKAPYRSRVDIVVGICASADLCRVKQCPFFDLSKEATCVFCQTQAYEHTLEGLREPRIKGIDEAIHDLLLDIYGIERRFDGQHNKIIVNPEYFENQEPEEKPARKRRNRKTSEA